MAKWECPEVQQYITQIEAIRKDSTGYIKRAVYEGGGVVADAIADAIRGLPTNDGKFVPGDAPISGVSQAQKDGLLEGLGLSKMQNESGYIYTKVGFDGYNEVKTKSFPNGQPNALIARAVESGTSRRPKTRFISKAVKAAKERAEKAMADRLDEDLKKATEE